ncbi:MAG: 2-hydroxyacyl-CoA dehydratase family protein [bacterium]
MTSLENKTTAAFTTTIPVEVLLASDIRPLDLNNIFVNSENPERLVEDAEVFGFPRSCCSWIKGMFSVLSKDNFYKNIDIFIAVTEGDCSNARVLAEIIAIEFGIETYIFNYPQSRSYKDICSEIERFRSFFGISEKKMELSRISLKSLRKTLRKIDELAYKKSGLISNKNYHEIMVSSSDFNGDPDFFEKETKDSLYYMEKKKFSPSDYPTLAYCGVPPAIPIHSFFDKLNIPITFNEIQREFAMIEEHDSVVDQYMSYTYPYSAVYRFSKFAERIKNRPVDGIIHYVQSFCHRQIEDIILRKTLKNNGMSLPILTVEGDKPCKKISGNIRTRLEAFSETLLFRRTK